MKTCISSLNGISVTFQKLVYQALSPVFGQVVAMASNELVGIHLHPLEDQTQLPSRWVAASSSQPLVIWLNHLSPVLDFQVSLNKLYECFMSCLCWYLCCICEVGVRSLKMVVGSVVILKNFQEIDDVRVWGQPLQRPNLLHTCHL